MTPAAWPREPREETRLLVVEGESRLFRHTTIADLPRVLQAGDLLVVNDAATLPASLPARVTGGAPIELRLAAAHDERDWWAVAFGPGDWQQRTEDRPPPPALDEGDTLAVGAELRAQVREVSPVSSRLLRLRFDAEGAGLWSALYRAGRPVQYSYVEAPLALWHVQTSYRSRPWAVEMPSAGHALTAALLQRVRARGVSVGWLTHGAGLSSTGDAALDAALPLPERYDVPAATVDAVERARRARGRVVAVGTTVVRALESAAGGGTLRAGPGTADLRLDSSSRLRVVDGILTGMHEPGSAHFRVLGALAPPALLEEAWREAEARGYLAHEFGDAMLVG